VVQFYFGVDTETAKRIKSLIAQGKPYTLAVYPGAEHGMTEYEIDANGDRVSTRFAPGYFQMMADFIRYGRIKDHYGNAAIDQVLRYKDLNHTVKPPDSAR
jgi:hypothetical protein